MQRGRRFLPAERDRDDPLVASGAAPQGVGVGVDVPPPAAPGDDADLFPMAIDSGASQADRDDADLGRPARGGASLLGRRRRAAVGVAAFCLLATVAGVAAARFIKSPAQVAAQTAPPPLTLLTAPVRFGVLTTTIVTRGTVLAGASVQAQPSSELGASRLVVSAVKVRVGTAVRPATVVAEVSGRPLIALPGAVSAYRDLRLRDRGNDVTQLQQALGAVGFGVGGDSRGVFGHGTERALAALYLALGYAPAGGPKAAYLPMSEVVYVPSFPAWVSQVDSELGAPLNGPAVTILYGRLRLRVWIDPADMPLVRHGAAVTLTPDFGGQVVRAIVISVGLPVVTRQGEQAPVRIRALRPLPSLWAGRDLQVTITSASTAGPVLYVPISAVSEAASGQASVTVERRGALVAVPVIAGASVSGFVAVRPVRSGSLAAGDRVVVGQAGR